MKLIATSVTALVLLAACKDKKPDPPATGPSPGPARPVVRPSQQPLPQLPALALPDDPKRTEKVALGKALFFDKRLSGHGDRACYSCHLNEDGLGGKDPVAIGSGDKPLTRHAPVLWNVAYFQNAFYWDGRAATLEDQAKAAWAGGNMAAGADKLDGMAVTLAAMPGYKKLFEAAYGTSAVKSEHVIGALAEYMRTMVCNDTAYDRFAAGDKSALTEQQQRGLDLFLGKGTCLVCHAPPHFSTAMGVEGGVYFNTGIGTQAAEDKIDVGRMAVTKLESDWGAFKPPTLRNVTKSPPYFHDGSVAKLDEAVRLMASGGIPNKNKNTAMVDRKLSDEEIADLVAFLGALDCPGALDEPALP
jgi:cytochrome c peroxidase